MYPQRANIAVQGLHTQMCADSGSHIRSPLPLPPLVPFHHSWIYIVGKKHSGKADQSTLASGGSEHAQLFIVAIIWGNKMKCMQTCQVFAQTVTNM